jgi:lipopolysaccharide assembly outer membrane protein LptD (OstA)
MKASWYKLKRNFWTSLLLIWLVLYTVALAKDKTKAKVTYRAEKLEGVEKDQESYKSLIGHVIFVHEGVTIKADSALYYDQAGVMEAFGNIEIIDQEGGVIVADQLVYDVNKKLAKLQNDVVYQSDSVTFYTDQLEYDVDAKKGYFFNGGELVEGGNTLYSESGCYDEVDKSAFFYNQVELKNEDYTLQCDTLKYNTVTKIAQFQGHTKIKTKEGDTLTTDEGGEYNTSNKASTFKRSKVESEAYTLSANLLRADQTQNYYLATGEVELIAKEHQVTIRGDHSEYWKDKGTIQVYGNPLLQRVLEKDTLYLTADTLLAIEDKQEGKNSTILAYNNVKIFQSDLQGIADSMAYHSIDSTIYFYNKPVFWSYNNQITADDIQITLNDQKLDKMYVYPNAFIASEDTLGNYNQLKGREMVAYFKDSKIAYINLEGNGESLYFAIDDQLQLVGMNYIKCSHMRIDMGDENLSKISFFVQPTGLFYPPQKIVEESKQLADFTWRIAERPTKEDVLEHGYGKKTLYKAFKFNE